MAQPAWQRLGLGVLSQVVSTALVDEAVAVTGTGQRRLRLLPARVVVLFVLALAVFSGQGSRQVWRELVSGWPGLARVTPTRSAFTQARRRLGSAPLAWLFTRVRGWCGDERMPGVFAFGLRLVAWDGTTLSVPDSEANAAAFGRTRGGKGAVGGYPRVRVLMVLECGTRAVIDAAFGKESEQVLAQRVLPALGPGMLLLADRNFTAYLLWARLRSQGVNLLWRLAGNRVLPVVRVLPDGSWLSRIEPPETLRKSGAAPVTVRVVRYTVTVTSTDADGVTTTRDETYRLVTSLLDPVRVPAQALAGCYPERWKIETGYQDLKTWLRGPSVVLRSHEPDGVCQEVWAYLVVYQALRHLLTTTAAQSRVEVARLSFLTGLHAARRKITNLAIVDGPELVDALLALADELLDDEIEPGSPRTSDRVVKRPVKSYKSKKPGMTSAYVAYRVDIRDPKAKETA